MLSWLLVVGLAGCATGTPQNLLQSDRADTHLGWQPAPENQLAYSVATASGIARLALDPLPENLDRVTLDLPGMQRVEGVQWRGDDGKSAMLYSGGAGEQGVTLEQRRRGFRLRIDGPALDLIRVGGLLTVVDFYRG
ncbi:hypothetical protein AWR36_015480 [Microbulbifer flavimaris]|uniref:Uncharacterized protein n=2 Tax=Microbulbiferaceae TaxID=1706373 RepID=A0ABX4HVR6_9GAMM|nr:hypothetical protein AVO43_15430 [Microbulbifer sp. ZGT114]PCO04091.1 hypothetical protein AWR36_015480 [Microbulbifer flavimaris]